MMYQSRDLPTAVLRVVAVIGLAGLAMACTPVGPAAEPAPPPKFSEHCPLPDGSGDDWPTGAPGDHGLAAARLDDLTRDARADRFGKLHSVLVVKDGRLVFERYFNGAGRDHCQLIASVTKSLLSLLVGMGLERAPWRSVDTPLIDFFPQYRHVVGLGRKATITLDHALTMTAGLDWDEYTHPHPDPRNPNTKMYQVADPKRFVFRRKLVHQPGANWAYNSGISVLLGAAVAKMADRPVDRFAAGELFAPLRIKRYHWFKHQDGTVFSNGDLLLTPRDLAKIGLLVLNQGAWQGQQVVPARWVDESTRRRLTTTTGLGYGYHWWRGATVRGGRRIEIIFGSGTGGQRLFIVPDLNLVVVVTARVFGNPAGPAGAARILADYLIPAALPEVSRVAVPISAKFLDAAAGSYAHAETGHRIQVDREAGTLVLKPGPIPQLGPVPPRIRLAPIAPGLFQGVWGQVGGFTVEIDTAPDGKVTQGRVNLMLRDRTYQKIEP